RLSERTRGLTQGFKRIALYFSAQVARIMSGIFYVFLERPSLLQAAVCQVCAVVRIGSFSLFLRGGVSFLFRRGIRCFCGIFGVGYRLVGVGCRGGLFYFGIGRFTGRAVATCCQ